MGVYYIHVTFIKVYFYIFVFLLVGIANLVPHLT